MRSTDRWRRTTSDSRNRNRRELVRVSIADNAATVGVRSCLLHLRRAMPNTSAGRSPSASKPTVKSSKTAPAAHSSVDRFPFAQYASVLGVHLTFVGFTALYLPQTTRLFVPLAVRKTDRPQSEFMETLTADPSLTLCWISVGLTLLQVWWANWVRKWSFKQTVKGTEVEIKLDRVKFDSLRLTVRRYTLRGGSYH